MIPLPLTGLEAELTKNLVRAIIIPAIGNWLETDVNRRNFNVTFSFEDLALDNAEMILKNALGALLLGVNSSEKRITLRLDRISEGIETLRAAFHHKIDDVLWKLEWQGKLLTDILSGVLEPFKTQAGALYRRAERSYRRGLYEEALQDLLAASRIDYESVFVFATLANIFYFDRHDLQSALKYFREAADNALNVHHDLEAAAKCKIGAARILSDMGNVTEAVTECRAAVAFAPAFSQVHYDLAKYSAMLGEGKAAAESLALAVLGDPHFYRLASDERALKDLPEIREIFEQEGIRLSRQGGEWKQAYVLSDEVQDELTDLLKMFAVSRTVPQKAEAIIKASVAYDHLWKTSWYIASTLVASRRGSVLSVAFSPDGMLLASGGMDDQVLLWDLNERVVKTKLVGRGHHIAPVVFSPNGRLVAGVCYLGYEQRDILIWNVETGELAKVLRSHAGIDGIAFSPDGKVLATSGRNHNGWAAQVKLWDAATWNLKQVLDCEATQSIGPLAYSFEGGILACLLGSRIRLWDVRTDPAKRVSDVSSKYGLESLQFSKDGKLLATRRRVYRHELLRETIGNCDKYEDTEYVEIALWDTRTWQVRHTTTLATQDADPFTREAEVTVHPSGEFVATGATNHTSNRTDGPLISGRVHLINARTGILERTLQAIAPRQTSAAVATVAFSPDGSILVSGGADWTVRILNQGLVAKEEYEKLEAERAEAEAVAQQAKEREDYRDYARVMGVCEIDRCERRLSVFDKLFRRTRCSRHRYSN